MQRESTREVTPHDILRSVLQDTTPAADYFYEQETFEFEGDITDLEAQMLLAGEPSCEGNTCFLRVPLTGSDRRLHCR